MCTCAFGRAAHEAREQQLMDTPIERRELPPALEQRVHVVVRRAGDQPLEQRDLDTAKPPSLCRNPRAKEWAVVELEPLEKLASIQPEQFACGGGCQRRKPCGCRATRSQCIDGNVAHIDADGVFERLKPRALLVVDEPANAAQAPAQLRARIIE
jgi:hypothetical protein